MAQDSFKLEISRTPIYNDGSIIYRLTAVCTVTASTEVDAIRLDQNVFVKLTQDSSFARVANASDLGLLKSSVDDAVSLGQTEYRDSVATFDFEDVDTAVAAIPVLRDRVNSSVYNYITYVKRFESTDEYPNTYSLPLPYQDQEARDAYILNFTDARQARKEAEESLSTAQSSLDNLGYKEEQLSKLKKIVCDLSAVVTSKKDLLVSSRNESQFDGSLTSSALYQRFTSVFQYTEDSSGNGNATVGDYIIPNSAYTSLVNDINKLESLFTTNVADTITSVTDAASALEIACQSLDGQYSTLEAQTTTIKESLDSLSTEVTDSSRAEAAALADLSEYCPDVDPDTL